MSRHSFDPEVAQKVGLNAAVIYQNILWWCERNAIKGRNVKDGNAWTFNSISNFEKLFSYLTAKQIRTALQKLEDIGLLEVGNFNAESRDRTKWYALAKDSIPFAQLVKPHLPLRADVPFAPEGKPLPDSKPDNKQTPISPEGTDFFSEEEEQIKPDQTEVLIEKGFKEFWDEIWPSHKRKTGKVDCRKVYRQACLGKHPKADQVSPADLNAAARRYIASVKDLEYLKGPLPWLRLPGWEPFMQDVKPDKPMTYAQRVLAAQGTGRVV